VADIIYNYAKERIGSDTLIKILLDKVRQASENAATFDPSVSVQLLVSLNLTGQTKTKSF
jgi:hypothetical protein